METKEKQAALIVDDDEVFRRSMCRAFSLRGWEAYEAADAHHALDAAREFSPDLAVVATYGCPANRVWISYACCVAWMRHSSSSC